jgi:DnaJ-class molecular chaperone
MQDPYQILGISRRASQAEIKQNYRRLAKELHPDRQPGNATTADKFKEIAAAYHVLGDAKQRSRFDRGEIDANGNRQAGYQPPPPKQGRPAGDARRQRARTSAKTSTGAGARSPFGQDQATASGKTAGKPEFTAGPKAPEVDATVENNGFNNFGFGGFSASDIFQPFFRKDKKAAPASTEASALDRHCKLQIGLLDAIKGGKKRMTLVPGQDVFVTVPPGVEDGQIIRLKGMGEKGRGKTMGDALVEISVKHHPWFVRVGNDIHVELPVTVQEAVLGAQVEVPTIDGPVSVRVPKGANAGVRLRLKGKGVIDRKNGTRGDQHLVIRIVLPENASEFEGMVKLWAPGNDYDVRESFRKLQE